MRAEGGGECNVIIYLIKQPYIYDVFRVRVSSVVKPYSPVYLHVGGQVQFKIMDQGEFTNGGKDTTWSSNNPSILDINQVTGEARALGEGRAEILLSNHISAASIVQVSKVRHGELDEQSRKNLIINTEQYAGDVRVRVKLYLHEQIEELMPSVQFDGITLIKQNVGIDCQSDNPDILQARGEVSDLEGFFCILSYKPTSSSKSVPKFTQISVTVFAPNPNKPIDIRSAIYSIQLLSFEVSYISHIKVESYYRNGIALNKDHRTASVRIYSNINFNVHVENERESDKGFDLVKYRVNRTEEDSTEYYLYVTVPQEITHDFRSKVIITHPTTGVKTTIPLIFEGRQGSTDQYQYASRDEEGFFSSLSKLMSGKQKEEMRLEREDRKEVEGGMFKDVFVISVVVIIVLFVFINCVQVDPLVRFKSSPIQ